jgi:Gylcosyl hydrolase family 115 C-terminal domain
MDADLVSGRNSLVIEPRESGAVIHRIVILEARKSPAPVQREPDMILGAADYTKTEDTAVNWWRKVEGLGVEGSAMTLLPYQSQPINDPTKAPAITYTFQSTSRQARIETRFLPTHPVHEGMGLRYTISVDGGSAQIHDLNSAEYSGTWSRNVLHEYARGTTTHALKGGNRHTITIRLLDPGVVLSQIHVFGS